MIPSLQYIVIYIQNSENIIPLLILKLKLFDLSELLWRCILRKQLEKLLAVVLGCMSAAILLAEATILLSGFYLSFFSILINAVGEQEMLTQVDDRKYYLYFYCGFLIHILFI